MTTTETDAVARIVANAAPVLAIDACSALDILRAPARNLDSSHLQAALYLLERGESDPIGLNIVIIEQAITECARHREAVLQECRTALTKLDESIRRVTDQHTTIGVAYQAGPALAMAGYGTASEAILDRFLDKAIDLEHTPYEAAAYARLMQNRRPSKNGDAGADCLIMETFVGMCAALQQAGHHAQRIFLTSNIADYGNDRAVHPDVLQDLGAVGASCAFTFAEARFALFPA